MLRKIPGFFPTFGVLLVGALWALPSFATSRTVYFTAGGKNRTVKGLAKSTSATSTCRIVISNPSAQSQNYTLNYNIQSIESWNGAGNTWRGASFDSAASSPNTCTPGGGSCSGTLAANGSATIVFDYFTFPDYQTIQSGSQTLRCSGSIVATDPTASPGFLFATGTLVTFTESAAIETDATTGGTAIFGGSAVYSQVPIVINRAKPF